MRIRVAWIGKTKEPAIGSLTAEYVKRIGRYNPIDTMEFAGEAALLKSVERGGRTAPLLVLLDARGRQFTSEEFAEILRDQQDRGTQEVVFAIGPADGWTAEAFNRADLRLSFGKMILAHELARVVLLEQLYRGFTIMKGHPYHTGH